MKIQLIKAPSKNTGMPEHDWYMPLNLIWLANYINQFGYDVEILDGQLLSLEEILNRIDAHIVGVGFDILSLNTFREIIKTAKRRGCVTVTGGHLATALDAELMNALPSLDAIVCYDGEEGLLGIARAVENKQKIAKNIKNVIFRKNESIIKNEMFECDLNKLPLHKRDIGGLDIEDYINNYQKSKIKLKLNFNYNRPINSYSHKGCIFRQNGGGCSFCSRVDQRFRVRSSKKVHEEYKYLTDKLNIDHISDFSDSWIYTPFLKDLIKECSIKGSFNASLRVYGDIRLINENNISFLKDLGVKTILLGIESGNERVLKLNGKNFTRRKIIEVVKLLAQNDINIADAYVLGLIGESKDSVKDTISLSEEIKKICETEISYWNIATPLPGSKIWRMLLNDNYSVNIFDLSTEWMEKLFIDKYCEIEKNGFKYLKEIRKKMLNRSLVASAEFINN